jgi:hypothetical protein
MVNIDKVAEVCAAYEMGHASGQLGLSTSYNEFVDGSEHFYAWLLGYNVGGHKVLLNKETDSKPN